MSCYEGNGQNWQQAARSLHEGGVNVCLCDGSVRFISDYVETQPDTWGTTKPIPLAVWDKLNLSNDGEPIDASKF